MYRGRRFYVSARQLGTAETKEASVQAANAWWVAKQSDLDLAYRASLNPPRTPLPAEDLAAAAIGSKEDWPTALRSLLAGLAESGRVFGQEPAEPVPVDEGTASTLLKQALGDLLLKAIAGGEPLPKQLAERLPPARAAQVERAVKELRGESAASPDRTVKALADDWFRGLAAQVRANGLSPDRADAVRRFLAPFVAFVGEGADVGAIEPATLTAFHRFCLSQIGGGRWGAVYARDIFATARSWIRWLVELGVIVAPANLASKGFRFGSTVKRIQTWTPDEVRQVIGEAPGKLKLALLLMLNCGMTQGDVADLLDSEVDWRTGRIIRRRSKTAARESVPVVNYRLWPATFSLLKQYRSGQDRVLLTDAGNPFMRKKMQAGKLVKVDGFARKYDKLRKRMKLKPMKLLRKTAASLLETHEVYGRFTGLFLGHTPASMKDRHYSAPPQALFDEAVMWLGDQLGVARIGE
jgi:integrase